VSETKTLYVTTFNRQLFDATGRNMLVSFQKYVGGDILVAYEDDIRDEILSVYTPSLLRNLNINRDLHFWLMRNEDVIPIKFGGKYPACKCPDPTNMWKGHKKTCLNGGFNSRASCWFRKVVALWNAPRFYDNVVFIDSDCEFIHKVTDGFITGLFDGKDCFYHLGKHRIKHALPIETGIIGFRGERGRKLIELVFNEFITGKFRQRELWSDSHIFTYIINEHPEIKCVDLVSEHTQFDQKSHVVCYGPFANYIRHDKGSHGRKHKIV